MATMDQHNEDEKAYAAAFDEDMQPAPEQSEDEQFGLAEEKAEGANDNPAEEAMEPSSDDAAVDSAEPPEGESPAMAIVVEGDDAAEEQAGAKDSAEAAAETDPVVAMADQPAPKGTDMDKEVQRLKSWEGRLKAMEAKLKAAGVDTPEEQTEAVAEAIEKSADATDTPADEDKVEQIAEQVEDGKMSVQQAMKQLADDFGPEFVSMIEAIATAKANEAGGKAATEKMGELKGTVDEIIGDIVDGKAKAHFEKIADAHPDFNEIGESEEFKNFIEALPDDQKGNALGVIANGSAKQIIGLIGQFKAAAPKEAAGELTEAQGESIVDEAVDETAMDAAEGVRSSGMKLPDAPQKSDDYASAWDQF